MYQRSMMNLDSLYIYKNLSDSRSVAPHMLPFFLLKLKFVNAMLKPYFCWHSIIKDPSYAKLIRTSTKAH
jgi:hypothetical protein